MPKKAKEQEQEIDLSTPKQEKKETKVVKWFRQNVRNNQQDIKFVCDLTARSAQEQFSMWVKSGNTELYAVIFYVTFIQILKFIASKQKSYNNFTIEICNSINIGYTNNDDESNEKVGNFMPIMEFISINRNIVDDSGSIDSDRTVQNFLRWKELNIKKNVEQYKEIQERTYAVLQKDYKVCLRTAEAVIPLFCIFMDNLSNLLKMKYREAQGTGVSEVSMNVMGLFDMFYSYDEDEAREIIDLVPNITSKILLKSDDVAARD
jgi:hypothetical protein